MSAGETAAVKGEGRTRRAGTDGGFVHAQLAQAQLAFVAFTEAKLNPSLMATTRPYQGTAEYVVVLGGRGVIGVIHEELEACLRICTEHGARLWLQDDGVLAAVWPVEDLPGPGAYEEMNPHEKEQRRGRGERRPVGSKAKRDKALAT